MPMDESMQANIAMAVVPQALCVPWNTYKPNAMWRCDRKRIAVNGSGELKLHVVETHHVMTIMASSGKLPHVGAESRGKARGAGRQGSH